MCLIEKCNNNCYLFFSDQKFLVSFSFIRNWYLLSAPTRKDMRDLRSISAVRIWTMIAIIYGHCSWFTIAVPIQNPIYVEQVGNGIDLIKYSEASAFTIKAEHKTAERQLRNLMITWLFVVISRPCLSFFDLNDGNNPDLSKHRQVHNK